MGASCGQRRHCQTRLEVEGPVALSVAGERSGSALVSLSPWESADQRLAFPQQPVTELGGPARHGTDPCCPFPLPPETSPASPQPCSLLAKVQGSSDPQL